MSNGIKPPLDGVVVVDFTTLAPGPLASLMLVNAGATVIKIERPGIGDEMRSYKDAFGDNGVTFALLNAGKRSLAADLKDRDDLIQVKNLIRNCDVVLEQFRPGVMAKLGLDYESLAKTNSRLIYCSITGFGQTGPKSSIAAHDLNYAADVGMLTIGEHRDGKPAIPQLLAADLAAGTYPAVMNILLALQRRHLTGEGAYIDVSMTDCLYPLMFWGLGLGWGSDSWPEDGNHLLTGASPRYQVYTTADGRFLAVAAIEERFWKVFCNLIGYAGDSKLERDSPSEMIHEIDQIVRSQNASHWQTVFDGHDACAVIASTLEEAVEDPHYSARGVFDRKIKTPEGVEVNALPMPIVSTLLDSSSTVKAVPVLGEFNTNKRNA